MELSTIDIDPDREVAGVWFSFDVVNEQLLVWAGETEPNGRDVGQLLVARAGNDRFIVKQYELQEEARGKQRSKDASAEAKAQRDILLDCEAETVLLSWRNIREGGVEVEPTLENRKRIYRRFKLIRQATREASRQITPYRFEDDEEGKKTSPPA